LFGAVVAGACAQPAALNRTTQRARLAATITDTIKVPPVAGAWWGIQITNLETEGGVPLAFSILCNHHHPTSDSDQVRAAQAAIVNALADLPLSMP
jgi:hypothetical protein